MKLVKKFCTFLLGVFAILAFVACGKKSGIKIYTGSPEVSIKEVDKKELNVEWAHDNLLSSLKNEDTGIEYKNAYDNPKNDFSIKFIEQDKDGKDRKDATILDPMKNAFGYAFDGWFKDSKYEEKVEKFPLTLKKGESLYAKYLPRKSEPVFDNIEDIYDNNEYVIKDLTNLEEELNKFNPIEGITASDKEGNEYIIKSNFDDIKGSIKKEGTYFFVITASFEKEDHRGDKIEFSTSQPISLVVGEKSQIQIEAPQTMTYYKNIGYTLNEETIREYISAYDLVKGEPYNTEKIKIEGLSEDLDNFGEKVNVVTLEARDEKDKVSRRTIKIYVKENPKIELPTWDELKEESIKAPIEIMLWHSNGDAIEKRLNFYGEQFVEKMAKLGVKVNLTVSKNGSTYPALLKNVINANQAGQMPNIVQGYPDHFFEYNNSKALMSLMPLIFHKDYGFGKEDGDVFKVQEGWTDFYPKYREEQMGSTPEGDILSLPFQKSSEVMIYNKEFFERIGVTNIPETWEGLMELIPKIREEIPAYIDSKENSAINKQESKDLFIPFMYDSAGNAFINLTKQKYGVYTSRYEDEKGKYHGRLDFVNNNQSKQALKQFGEWAKEGNISSAPVHFDALFSSDSFQVLKCVVTMSSSAGAGHNLPYKNGAIIFDPHFAPLPHFEGGRRSAVQQGPSIALVNDKSPNNEERFTKFQTLVSWLFMKYLTSKEVNADFVTKTSYQPIRQSVKQTETYKEFISLAELTLQDALDKVKDKTEEERKVFLKQVLQARSISATETSTSYQSFDIPFIGSSSVRDEVGKIYERVLRAGKAKEDLDETIKQAYHDAESFLKSIVR